MEGGRLVFVVLGVVGCCGKDTPTGSHGQTLEVWIGSWDNGNVEEEYQYYRDQEGKVRKQGYYK